MIKYIKYDEEFQGADGAPYAILSPNKGEHKKVRDESIAAGLKEGTPRAEITWEAPTLDKPTFAQVIQHLLNDGACWHRDEKNQEEHPPGAEALGFSYAVLRAFRKPIADKEGQLWVSLEDDVYNWLMEWNKEEGPKALRLTQAVVQERLMEVKEAEIELPTKDPETSEDGATAKIPARK